MHSLAWPKYLLIMLCLSLTAMGAVSGVALAATTRTTLHLTNWSISGGGNGGEESFTFKGTWDNPQYPAGCSHAPVQLQVDGTWNIGSHTAITITSVVGPCSSLRYRITTWFSCQNYDPWLNQDSHCSFMHASSSVGAGGYDSKQFPSRRAMPKFRDFPVSLLLSIGSGIDGPGNIIKLIPDKTVYLDTVAWVPISLSEYVAVNSKMHYDITYSFYGKDKQWHYKTIKRDVAIQSDQGTAGARLILDRQILRVGEWDVTAWYSWDGRRIYANKHLKFSVRPPVSVGNAPVPKATLVSPHNGQILVNQDVNIEIQSRWRHKDNSKWEYQFEWMQYKLPRNSKSSNLAGAWPLANKNPALPKQANTLEVGGGTQVLLKYNAVKPSDNKHIAWYRFRVREHYIPNGTSQFGYGPWSNWFDFGVAQPIRGGLSVGSGNRQFGSKVINRTALKTSLPAVQHQDMSHKNIRFGGKLNNKLVLPHQAPAMHTMSDHLGPGGAPKHYAHAPSHEVRRTPAMAAPRLQVLSNSISLDGACRNLTKFITLRATLINEGGPLAGGYAHMYVKESGGAHIASRSVAVPALSHGARTTVTLSAGTRGAYRSKIPGRHTLLVEVVVTGKTSTTRLAHSFRRGFCQGRHSRVSHHSNMRMRIKLNPQPEPPSTR